MQPTAVRASSEPLGLRRCVPGSHLVLNAVEMNSTPVPITLRLMQDPVYLNSQETRRYLDAQHQELRGVLVELGLAKQ